MMRISYFNTLSRWVLPGLIAGAVFLVIALVTGALATTVWAMPDAIAQTIGIAAPARYSFALAPVLVGIAVHLALSIGLGAMFTAFAWKLRLHGWKLVAAAVLFITIETPIALWVVMNNVLPATTFCVISIPSSVTVFWSSTAPLTRMLRFAPPATTIAAPPASTEPSLATGPSEPAGAHLHTVVPGYNLWTIAAAELTRQTGRTPDHLAEAEIRSYWLRVIAANRDRLRSGDPTWPSPTSRSSVPRSPGGIALSRWRCCVRSTCGDSFLDEAPDPLRKTALQQRCHPTTSILSIDGDPDRRFWIPAASLWPASRFDQPRTSRRSSYRGSMFA